MKVLVTGGAGFVGSHTVDLLLQKGYQVRVLDALLPPVHLDGQVPEYLPLDDIEFIQADVRHKAAWEKALQGVDAVIHLAAYQDYLPDFSTFFHTNTVGTALLYEVIVEQKLPIQKVVFASSQAVYGEAKYRCRKGEGGHPEVVYPELRGEAQLRRGKWELRCPVCGEALEPQWTDEAVVKPHNQYAMSKYTQEMVAFNLGGRYGIPSVGMRYSIVQGSRQSFRNAYSGVLRIFAQRLLNGKPPVCYEDGGQIRDYVSVHDVARANLLVLEDPSAGSGQVLCADGQPFDGLRTAVFNVGGDRRVTVLEYAHLIAERAALVLGENGGAAQGLAPQVPGLYRFGDTRHVSSDVGKLKALGWRPEVPLEAIVDEYLTWAGAQPGFADYYAQAEARMQAVGTLRRVEK